MNEVTRAELKCRAKHSMQGNLGSMIVCMIIVAGVSCMFSWAGSAFTERAPAVSTALSIFGMLFSAIAALGMANLYITAARRNPISFETAFGIFKDMRRCAEAVIAFLLVGIFTFLWSLLFVVPGIIKAIGWSQTLFIMAEHPDIHAKEAMDISAEIMEGHKMEYFVLQLSFLLWLLLCIVTCGIASFYVEPYMETTNAHFYAEVSRGFPFDGPDM